MKRKITVNRLHRPQPDFLKCCKFLWKAGNIFISLSNLKGFKRSSVFWTEITQLMGIYGTSFVMFLFLQFKQCYLLENKESFCFMHLNELHRKCTGTQKLYENETIGTTAFVIFLMGCQWNEVLNITVAHRASQSFYNLFWKWSPFLISLGSIYFATSIRSGNTFWELKAGWAWGIKNKSTNCFGAR